MTIPGLDFEVPYEMVVMGLITGLTYGLLAMGLALAYRSARVLNFAHGEIGAMAYVVVALLVYRRGWSYWPALVAGIAASIVAALVLERALVRRLRDASRLMLLVGTIGFGQALFVVVLYLPNLTGAGNGLYPEPFRAAIDIGNLRLGGGHILIVVAVPVLVLALGAILRYHRVGVASRAVAENHEAAAHAGIPVGRVSVAVWVMVGAVAGAAAVLLGPSRPIATLGSGIALGAHLLVRVLAAGLVGGLTSLPLVFAGGLAVGVAESLVYWNYPSGGMFEVVLLVAVVASLLLQPSLRRLARGAADTTWSLVGGNRAVPPALRRVPRVRAATGATVALALVVAFAVPSAVGAADRSRFTTVVVFAVIALSVVVLTGFAGQVSLGQFAFAGIGALLGGRLIQLGFPWLAALAVATVAGGVVAVAVGLPALRIRGLFLAVATLAFALACSTWLFSQSWLVHTDGDGSTSLTIARPSLPAVDVGSELGYYRLCLAVLVVVAYAVHRLRRGPLGRAIVAVRDNEAQAASFGIAPWQAKLAAFGVSGMIAALGGFLLGGLLVHFPNLEVFAPDQSMALLAMGVVGGVGSVAGAVLGAIALKGIPVFAASLLDAILSDRLELALSSGALLAVVLQFPRGLSGVWHDGRDRVLAVLAPAGLEPAPVTVPPPSLIAPAEGASASAIEAVGVRRSFGGVVALDDVTVRMGDGEIVGLIGPNGAGKSTLFDVLSGHVRPDRGSVLLDGVDVTRKPPERRAALGLGRSFQGARLFEGLRLDEAVTLALQSAGRTSPVRSLVGSPGRASAAGDLLDLLGIAHLAHRDIGELSTGTRRVAELACMIALGARVLLLDEPTAGMAQPEVEAFAPVLREVRAHLRATVVLVEHDMPLVAEVADRVYVMAAGAVIAEGAPAQVWQDPGVVAAYLGTDERAVARSGARRDP